MLEFLRSALAIVFVFGIVVFIHELGHFLAAKWTGVYAPRFSIGFGPALWSRKWGETEYIIAAIPLGGYVRMASREDEPMALLEGGPEQPAEPHTIGGSGARVADESDLTPAKRPRYYDPNAMAPFGPKPVPEDRLFESKSLPARLFIMVAGVTMNLLLGFAVLTLVYLVYGRAEIRTRAIGAVHPVASAPQLAERLHPGDTITAVDGRPVSSWNELVNALLDGKGDTVRIATQRGEAAIPVDRPGAPRREEIAGAIEPFVPPLFGRLLAGQPGRKAGLEPGDSVVAVAGRPIRSWGEMVDVIEVSAGKPVPLRVVRDGREIELVVTPAPFTEPDPVTGKQRTVGKIGAVPRPLLRYERVSLREALALGGAETIAFTTGVVDVLRNLATGAASPRELGGIIQIASESAEAAKVGFDSLLRFLALISINLAVFNLLPIPILDGGQILINVAEAVRGKAFSDRTRQWIAYAGLSTIVLLVVFALFNDISRHL